MAAVEGINPEGLASIIDDTEAPTELTPSLLENLLEPPSTSSEFQKDRVAGQITAITGDTLNSQQLALAKTYPDPNVALSSKAQSLFESIQKDIAQQGSNLAGRGVSPEILAPMLEEAFTKTAQESTGPAANEKAVLKGLSTVPLRKAVEDELAFALAAHNELASMIDKQGNGDFALDIAGLFIPFRLTRSWEDFKNGVENNNVLNKELTGNSIANMIGSFQALPVDRKRALWPAIVQTMLDASGLHNTGPFGTLKLTDKNTLVAIGMLMHFLEPEGGERAVLEQRVQLGLDVVSVLPLLKTASGIIKEAKGSVKGAFREGLGPKPAPGFGPGPEVTPGAGAARRPTPETPFPRTDASQGVTVEGEVVSSKMEDLVLLPQDVRKAMEVIAYETTQQAMKESNLIKLAKAAGEEERAAALLLGAMDDPAVAKAVGLDSLDIYQTAMPWQVQDWLPQVAADVAPEIAEAINSYHSKLEGFVRSMSTESEMIRLGALNKSERVLAKRNFEQEMERIGEDYLNEGIHLRNLKYISETSHDFTFQYEAVNKQGDVNVITGRRAWGINQVTGRFTETVLDLAASPKVPGQSVTAWASVGRGGKEDFFDTAQEAMIVSELGTGITQELNKMFISAHKGDDGRNLVNARRMERIHAVELAGDEYINPDSTEWGRTFLPEELLAGIPTRNGTVYLNDPKDVEVYYKRRLFVAALHTLENELVRKELETAGMKAVFVKPVSGEQTLFAKPYDTKAAALSSLRRRPGYGVWDSTTGKVVTWDDKLITEAYDKGKVLARTREDWNTVGEQQARGGEYVEYVLVPKEKVRNLPEQVLHYKEGYVPQAYQNIEYTVKQKWPIAKRGTFGRSRSELIRGFASKLDAQKFLEQMKAKGIKDGLSPEVVDAMYTMETETTRSMTDKVEGVLSSSNGLFTGVRAKGQMLSGLTGIPAERVAPSEMLSRYMSQIGNKLSRSAWAAGNERRWLNTVKAHIPDVEIKGFNTTALPPDNPLTPGLERVRSQMQKWNTIPTRKESLFEAGIQKMHDWVLNGARWGGISKEAVPTLLWLKHTDPISAILSANMHLTLGTLNPAQIYVQSSAMVVALSLTPIKNIPNVVRDAALLSALDNIKDDTVFGKWLALWHDSPDELIGGLDDTTLEMFRAWRRAPHLRGIRSNADMYYTASTGLGVTADWLRSAEDVSLMFYRTGELANRRVSFMAAYHELLGKYPSGKINGNRDDFIVQVSRQANNYMFELEGANRAWWQGGNGTNAAQRVASMFGQFSQVLTRTVEFALKGEKHGGWTPRRKARFAAAQLALFGARGVPLLGVVGAFTAKYISDMAGLDPNKDATTIESIANALEQGFSGIVAWEVMGAKVDVADRAALGSSIFFTVKDILTSPDPVWLKMWGLTGTTARNLVDVGQNSYLGFRALYEMSKLEPLSLADRTGQQELTNEHYKAVFKDIGRSLAGLSATTRNGVKSHLMRYSGKVLDRRGRVLTEGDFNWQTELAVLMGFQPSAATRTWGLINAERAEDELVRGYSDMLITKYHELIYIHNMDPAYADLLRTEVQVIQEALENPGSKDKLRASLASRMMEKPMTLEEKAIKHYIEKVGVENIAAGMIKDSENVFNVGALFASPSIQLPLVELGRDTKTPKTEVVPEDDGTDSNLDLIIGPEGKN